MYRPGLKDKGSGAGFGWVQVLGWELSFRPADHAMKHKQYNSGRVTGLMVHMYGEGSGPEPNPAQSVGFEFG